jgi:hypothetical protein
MTPIAVTPALIGIHKQQVKFSVFLLLQTQRQQQHSLKLSSFSSGSHDLHDPPEPAIGLNFLGSTAPRAAPPRAAALFSFLSSSFLSSFFFLSFFFLSFLSLSLFSSTGAAAASSAGLSSLFSSCYASASGFTSSLSAMIPLI